MKTCFRCGKQGHLARKCRAAGYRERSGKPDKEQMSSLLADASAEDDDLCISSVYAIKSQAATVCLVQPVRKKLCWGGIDVSMEIDTGSPVCVIPRNVYLQCRNQWPSLAKSELRLNCYRLPKPLNNRKSRRCLSQRILVRTKKLGKSIDAPQCGSEKNKNATNQKFFCRFIQFRQKKKKENK